MQFKTPINRPIDQKGFSLVEMMVAMLIGLFLMGGVVSVFISSSQSSKVNTGLRTMQENGRFALTLLKSSIQMGGYIAGYDPSDVINPFPTAGDDSLTIRYEASLDCTGESTLGFSGVNAGFVQDLYYIEDSQLKCKRSEDNNEESLIEGVDQMRILYGLDDNNDGIADRYVKAADVANFQDDVSSVRIALLMNSVTNIKPAEETKTYSLLDTTVDITDRMLHKVFTTTILIRNRMI